MEGQKTMSEWLFETLEYNPDESEIEQKKDAREPIPGCQSALDAVVKVISRGEPIEDLENVAIRCGISLKEMAALRGTVVFQDPSFFQDGKQWEYTRGYVLREQYLSGDVLGKYRLAKEMDRQYPGCFQPNITELKKLLPYVKDLDEIRISLGSRDVDSKYYEQFIWDTFHLRVTVRYSREMAKWIISMTLQNKDRAKSSELNRRIFGTKAISAIDITERIMNGRPIRFEDMRRTLEARVKQEMIRGEWEQWLGKLGELQREQLLKNYILRLGRYCGAHYSGQLLSLPDLHPGIHLRIHQRQAVEHALLGDQNCLVAYPTGSGKTYIYIAIAHERKRLGLSKKTIVVVPNNVLKATVNLHHKMYPDDAVFCVEPSGNFKPGQRRHTLEHLCEQGEEYTCIYIPFSSFDMIKMPKEYWLSKYEDEIRELHTAMEACHYRKEKHQLENLLKKKKKTYYKCMTETAESDQITYDELGFDLLICDEVQYYKNPSLVSRNLDFAKSGAARSNEFREKVHNTERVIFGTATPITNSYSELYVLMDYLMPDVLKESGLDTFDSWINAFAEVEEVEEINELGTAMKVRSRYKTFHNIQQLIRMFSMCLEFTSVEEGEKPLFSGYRDINVARGPELDAFFRELEKRACDIKTEKDDNILKIMMQARLGTLDLRLLGKMPDKPAFRKTTACTNEVFRTYSRYPGCSQIIFCDLGVPGNITFNIYQEIKDLLIAKGIPGAEIAFIHDATDKTREKMINDVNEGKIRVIIGSTEKLGVGVNCQKHLKAVHHLSVPWRASDILQREGRIVRDGNEYEDVLIYRYFIKDTFDAYLWQTVERKAKEYCQLLGGMLDSNEIDDMEMTACTAGEIKAMCIGNPLIKTRAVIANELEKARIAARQENKEFAELEAFVASCPDRISGLRQAASDAMRDWEYHTETKKSICREEREAFGEELLLAIRENVMVPRERFFGEYRSIQVILPAGFFPSIKPYVYLKRPDHERKYYLEMDTESAVGCCQRIDGFLGNLNRYSEKLRMQSDDLEVQLEAAEKKLSSGKTQGTKVEELTRELESVDAMIKQEELRYA